METESAQPLSGYGSIGPCGPVAALTPVVLVGLALAIPEGGRDGSTFFVRASARITIN